MVGRALKGFRQEARREAKRWPGAIALLAIGALYLAVSELFTVGPVWLPLALVAALLVLTAISRLRGRHGVARALVLGAIALLTFFIASSAVFLVTRLVRGQAAALDLLRDAALIWVGNVVVFALWYWELDAGGPVARHKTRCPSTDFLFPQMTRDDPRSAAWLPSFVDYLFLAFNTSTALSPTDTMVLTHRAKLLMMAQALISLMVIAVLAARAINTL
jgi:hypothetical protein